MGKFEKYIQDNREELDNVENVPREEMWNVISGSVRINSHNTGNEEKNNKTIIVWKRLAIAAMLLAFMGWGLWIFGEQDSSPGLEELFPEVAEKERKFQHLILEKEKEIDLENIDKEMFQDVFEDLNLLQKNTAQARQDILSFPENDRAIETLIRSYELKIKILENLNRQLDIQKNHEEYEKSL